MIHTSESKSVKLMNQSRLVWLRSNRRESGSSFQNFPENSRENLNVCIQKEREREAQTVSANESSLNSGEFCGGLFIVFHLADF